MATKRKTKDRLQELLVETAKVLQERGNELAGAKAAGRELERLILEAALKEEGWKLLRVAKRFAITISTAQRLLERHPGLAAERAGQEPS